MQISKNAVKLAILGIRGVDTAENERGEVYPLSMSRSSRSTIEQNVVQSCFKDELRKMLFSPVSKTNFAHVSQ